MQVSLGESECGNVPRSGKQKCQKSGMTALLDPRPNPQQEHWESKELEITY